MLKTKTIITELLKSSQKESKEVKEDESQIIEDYAKAFDHLKSHCSSLDLFRHYNISVYFGLHGMQKGNLNKSFFIDLARCIGNTIDLSVFCAKLLAMETEKYLTTFFKQDLDDAIANNIKRIHYSVDNLGFDYIDMLCEVIEPYKTLLKNHNAKNTYDIVFPTDFEAGKKAVTAEFTKILKLMRETVNFDLPSPFRKSLLPFKAKLQIGKNESPVEN